MFSALERLVSQHQQPNGPGHEDNSPHQQGGDGSQMHGQKTTPGR